MRTARKGMRHGDLNVIGQACGEILHIDFNASAGCGFKKNGMAVLFRESHHLRFNGRTVARADAGDFAVNNRGAVQVLADDPVGFGVGADHAAPDFAEDFFLSPEIEADGIFFAFLALYAFPVDAVTIKPRRCACFQALHHNSQVFHRLGKTDCRLLAHRPREKIHKSHVNAAVEMGAGGQNHFFCLKGQLEAGFYAFQPAVLKPEGFRLILKNAQVRAVSQLSEVIVVVIVPVALGAQRAHSRAFRGVQPAHHHGRGICRTRLNSAECGNFAHQMPFCRASDRRIAGHMGDAVHVLNDHQRAGAHFCRGKGGLAAGVPAADHNDIKTAFGKNLHSTTCFLTAGRVLVGQHRIIP